MVISLKVIEDPELKLIALEKLYLQMLNKQVIAMSFEK